MPCFDDFEAAPGLTAWQVGTGRTALASGASKACVVRVMGPGGLRLCRELAGVRHMRASPWWMRFQRGSDAGTAWRHWLVLRPPVGERQSWLARWWSRWPGAGIPLRHTPSHPPTPSVADAEAANDGSGSGAELCALDAVVVDRVAVWGRKKGGHVPLCHQSIIDMLWPGICEYVGVVVVCRILVIECRCWNIMYLRINSL
jgi:hypothetical protein